MQIQQLPYTSKTVPLPPEKQGILPVIQQAILNKSSDVKQARESLKNETTRIQKIDEDLEPLIALISFIALMTLYSLVLTIPGGLPLGLAIASAFYLTLLTVGLALALTDSDSTNTTDDKRLRQHVAVLEKNSRELLTLNELKIFFTANEDSELIQEFLKKDVVNITTELEALKKQIEQKLTEEKEENKKRMVLQQEQNNKNERMHTFLKDLKK